MQNYNPEHASQQRPERNWGSFGLSFLFHGSLFILLWIFGSYSSAGDGLIGEPDRKAGIVLTQRDATSDQQEYLDESDTVDQLTEDSSQSSAEAAAMAEMQAPEIPETASSPRIALPGFETSNAMDANKMAATEIGGNPKAAYELTDTDREMIAADQAYFDSLQPAGPATALSVFGSGRMTGRSFLFLLDRSKSMGSGGLGVMQVARRELARAIDQLEDHHKFQVLGYNDGTTPMKVPRLLDATDEHKRAVPEFIANMAAYGRTKHDAGLLSAVAYRPDVIVFMTDGDLPGLKDSQLEKIRRAADGKIQIHCIQFGLGGQRSEGNFMETLARQNGGTFRYVDVNDLNR
jgi:hypothetical protein